jgi:phosphonatase-like hydrolase
MEIKLVVFDLAGTTVNDDDSVNRCVRAALEQAGLRVTAEAVNQVMGIPKPLAIRHLLAGTPLLDQADAIYADFVDRSIRFYREDPSVFEVPGALEVFRALDRSGIKVALNTGFNRAITDVILDRLGWARESSIHSTISSDEVARGRPHPDMIHELMRRLDVSPAAAVAKVGDTPADLEEGSNAGCGMNVGVTQGTHTREELERCPHTHLVETIRAVPGLLGVAAP